MISASRIADATRGQLHGEDTAVDSFVVDSRQVTPGSLYVALPGERVDGHDFLQAARDAGATAALVTGLQDVDGLTQIVVADTQTALADLARDVLAHSLSPATTTRPSGGTRVRPRVIAVTGSVGKTTTKDLLVDVLGTAGVVHANRASFNNEVGLPLTVLATPRDAVRIVVEMGADAPGNLTHLAGIAPPDVAVVLAVGHAHLEGFGSVEGVAAAKGELVAALGDGGTAVLNADDSRVAAMRDRAGSATVLTFSASGVPSADVRAAGITMGSDGCASFQLAWADQSEPVTLRLVGEHHVVNALAAATVAIAEGLDLAAIAAALSTAQPRSPHRMAVSELPGGITLIDDTYNANPESMRAALKALVALAAGRRTVAVLGEMRELGADSLLEHDALGRLAVRLDVSKLLVVGRGARPLFTGALLEGSFAEEAAFVEDIDQAREWLAANTEPGDVVLLKSSNGAGLFHLANMLTGGDA